MKQKEMDFSTLYKKTHKTIEERKSKLVKAILYQNGLYDQASEQVSEEVFELIDKVFYKIDKALQAGFKSVIDYFATTTILLDELVEYRTKTPGLTTLYKLRKDFQKFTKELPFYKVSKRKVPVMMGLDIKLHDIVKILQDLEPYAREAEDKVKHFQSILQTILDGKENRLADYLDPKFLKYLKSTENKISNQLKRVTNSNILADRKPLKDVADNWEDMDNCIQSALKLGVTYNMERLEDIYIANENNNELLNILYKNMSNSKDPVDKEFLKMFIEYVENMAKYITSLGFLYYLYYQLVDMLVAIIKALKVMKEDPSVIDSLAYGIKKGYQTVINALKSIL